MQVVPTVLTPEIINNFNELDILRSMYSLQLFFFSLFTLIFFIFCFIKFLKWLLPNYWYKDNSNV